MRSGWGPVPRFDLEQTAPARRSAECNVVTGKDKAMRTALALTRALLALLLWARPPVHAAPPARGSGSGGMEKTIRALERAYFSNLSHAHVVAARREVDAAGRHEPRSVSRLRQRNDAR